MPSFNVYTGNRLELLLNDLAEVVSIPHVSPAAQEIIVVQNKGMERWIATQLAKKLGIWAHCTYPFPNAFVNDIFKSTLQNDAADTSVYDSKILVWTLMDMLSTLPDTGEYAPLRDYLGLGTDIIKQYQLAAQIADVFDQYTVFRPDMVLAWENGKDNHWQAQLWRSLVQRIGTSHRAHLHENLLQKAASGSLIWNNTAQRISVFGISSLSPLHIDVIHALSSKIDVHVFLLNPCAEYWDDVASEREINRTIRRSGNELLSADELHLEQGNSLLAALGSTGRDFLRLLHNHDPVEHEHSTEPGSHSMLTTVQSDILHLQQRGSHNEAPALQLSDNDISIQIHSCHSPMREVTVLYDTLLNLFDTMPGLTPSDIVVMTTDIETYTPYIHAQFGFAEQDTMRIPYTVADRSSQAESLIVNAFITIISLAEARCTTQELLSLLDVEPLRRAFTIDESTLETIKVWVGKTNIRWGLDQNSCEAYITPAYPENTWEQGIHSMLMGYAMSSSETDVLYDIAPFDGIEGSNAAVLGHFLDFMRAVDVIARSCSTIHTLPEWEQLLLNCIKHFFVDDDTTRRDLNNLHTAIASLSAGASHTGYSGAIDMITVRSHLVSQLAGSGSTGFLTGNLTFCEMLPMRSIPFKVVCLLGINDTSFPRKSRHVAWDYCAQEPRIGDRILEKEDRYLFLEALLSARDVFYVSYIGQDEHDGTERQPSVVVTGLIDYCFTAFSVPDTRLFKTVKDFLLRTHPLQAFSTRYFSAVSRLLNYSRESYTTSLLAGTNTLPQSFVAAQPMSKNQEPLSITIDDLCRCIVHPSRWFLEKKLGITLSNPEAELAITEPFFITGLEGYNVGTAVVEQLLIHQSPELLYKRLRAEGRLPHGTLGKCAFDSLVNEASGFVGTINRLFGAVKPAGYTIQGTIQNITITGTLDCFTPAGLVSYRYAHIKPEDRLKAWLRGIIAKVLGNVSPSISILCSRDTTLSFTIPQDADMYLKEVLNCYVRTMQAPIHFFPSTSWAFAEHSIRKNKSAEEALAAARDVWNGKEYGSMSGEANDLFNAQCFSNTNPLDEEFMRLSLLLFEPLIRNEEKVDL